MGANRVYRDYAMTIALAIGLAWIIRSFMIEAYRIPTATMTPTLQPGDTIFVAKWGYGWGSILKTPEPSRGDVVVYVRPEEPGRESIKRVIALAGEKFEIKQGHLWINGAPIQATTPLHEKIGGRVFGISFDPPLPENAGPEIVPADRILVVADARTQPDGIRSQIWHLIPISALRGKAIWIWMSFDSSRIRFERMFKRL